MNLTFGTKTQIGFFDRTFFVALSGSVVAVGNYAAIADGQGGVTYHARPSVIKYVGGEPSIVLGPYDVVDGARAVIRLTDTKFVLLTADRAWVCTWNGVSVSRGSAYTLPARTGQPSLTYYSLAYDGGVTGDLVAAGLNATTFVIAGTMSGTGKAYVGIVNGTVITFYAATQFHSSQVYGMNICRLDDNRFVISYAKSGDSTTYFVAGTRNGGTQIAFGTTVSITTGNLSGQFVSVEKVSSSLAVLTYRGVTGYPAARTANISGTTISFNQEVAASASLSRNTQHGCGILPPVEEGLWPRRFVIAYTKDHIQRGYPSYDWRAGIFARMGTISSTGAISFVGDPVYCDEVERDSPATYIKNVFVKPLSTWTFALGWFHRQDYSWRMIKYAAIDPMQQAITFSRTETLAITPVANNHVIRSLSEMLSILAYAAVVPNKVAKETLALDESIAFLSSLIRILSEGIAFLDSWELGGDAGLRKTFGERLGFSDDVINNPHKLAQEIIGIYDRLRLGGVFDDPVCRITTAILKAGLKTEKL